MHDGQDAGREQGANASRTIEVRMSDSMRFSPEAITAKRGETIRFVLINEGKLPHEMMLGTKNDLQAHAAEMRGMAQMPHGSSSQNLVDPGKTGEVVWKFTRAGTVEFACLVPGHMESGMRGKIEVSP